jgi:hypothetical protein
MGYSWTVDWRQVSEDQVSSCVPETSVSTLEIFRRPVERLPFAHSPGERLESEDDL